MEIKNLKEKLILIDVLTQCRDFLPMHIKLTIHTCNT